MAARRFLLFWIGCGLLAGGCSRQESEPAPTGPTVTAQMHQSFEHVTAIRDAVIASDLEALREPARRLAENEPAAGLPEGWKPHVSAMQGIAAATADTDEIIQASSGAVSMARHCGRCHEQFEANVSFAYPGAPAEGDTAVARMLRHTWAADRMWEGLIAPSNMAWNWGVDLLTEAPMTTDDIAPDSALGGQIDGLARHVHRLGVRGIQEQEWDERARIYGEFLATCATCHQLLAAGPRRRRPSD